MEYVEMFMGLQNELWVNACAELAKGGKYVIVAGCLFGLYIGLFLSVLSSILTLCHSAYLYIDNEPWFFSDVPFYLFISCVMVPFACCILGIFIGGMLWTLGILFSIFIGNLTFFIVTGLIFVTLWCLRWVRNLKKAMTSHLTDKEAHKEGVELDKTGWEEALSKSKMSRTETIRDYRTGATIV